jgi:hypothetical protein
MSAWLRLTWLFGLSEDEQPEDLMIAALGPVLRASQAHLAAAPLPARMQELLEKLADRERHAAPCKADVVEQHVLATEALRRAGLAEQGALQLS